jgi:hypothetical protein
MLVVVLVPGLMHVGMTMAFLVVLMLVLVLDVSMIVAGMRMHVRFAGMVMLVHVGNFMVMVGWHGSSSSLTRPPPHGS